MKKTKPKIEVIVKQTEEAPVSMEIMAESIVAISNAAKKMRSSKLTDKALFILIQNACPAVGFSYKKAKPGIAEIRGVFEGIANLEKEYIK